MRSGPRPENEARGSQGGPGAPDRETAPMKRKPASNHSGSPEEQLPEPGELGGGLEAEGQQEVMLYPITLQLWPRVCP